MESATDALQDLAKGALRPGKIDEWDDFGKDIANTIRGLDTKSLQRKAKFAVQQVLFQVPEHPSMLPYPMFQIHHFLEPIQRGTKRR